MLTDKIIDDTIQLQTKQKQPKQPNKRKDNKMKTYVYFREIDENTLEILHIYAGNACEIEKKYKQLGDTSYLFPLYLDAPKFNANKNYGIIIENSYFRVITEDVLKEYLVEAYEEVETV